MTPTHMLCTTFISFKLKSLNNYFVIKKLFLLQFPDLILYEKT